MAAYLIQMLMAFTGTIAFSVLFSVAPKHYLQCGLIGAGGWGVYLAANGAFGDPVTASLISSFALTALARYLSVRTKTPATVFLLTGIFTLVPGAGIFYTAYYLFFNRPDAALSAGLGTLKTAIAIGLGIGIVYSIPGRVYGWKRDSEIWNETAAGSRDQFTQND